MRNGRRTCGECVAIHPRPVIAVSILLATLCFTASSGRAQVTTEPKDGQEQDTARTQERGEDRQATAQKRYLAAKEEFDALLSQREADRSRILESCGVGPESVIETLLALEKEHFALAIEVDVKRATIDVIQKEIADAKAATSAALNNGDDRAVKLLKELVGLRQKTYREAEEYKKRNPEFVPNSELNKLAAAVIDAELQLVLRQEMLAKSVAGVSLDELSGKHRELTLSLDQDALRARTLDERIKRLTHARKSVDEYEQFGQRIKDAAARLRVEENGMDGIRRATRQ